MKENKYAELQKLIDSCLKKNIKVEYIHGYLTAVLCAPEMILPSTWVPVILEKDSDVPEFKTKAEAEKLTGALMEFYNEISRTLNNGSFFPLYTIDNKKISPGKAKIWCKGFILGLNLWETDFASDEDAMRLVLPVFFLADKKFLKDTLKYDFKVNYTDEQLKEVRLAAFDDIPESIIKLHRYYQQSPKITNVKPGRNEPCPCGSGKKYKKCCGAN
jgi:uncharacterized protein